MKKNECSVYRFEDKDGNVLRVGKTCQDPPKKRIYQQRNEPYFKQAEKAIIEDGLSPSDADCLERILIDKFDPPYNKTRPDPKKCYLEKE